MNQPSDPPAPNDDSMANRELWVAVAAIGVLAIAWSMGAQWQLLFLLSEAVLISIVISQACDPFADAAQWIGMKLGLPGSVRGATLDAIASSMPELFTGIFFVVLAMTSAQGDPQLLEAAGADGFGATIATIAGSAVYNMILIPAFCAIFIARYRPERPTIDIDDAVIKRDGLWFLAVSILLILFLWDNTMSWYMGVAFLGLYGVYVTQLLRDAGRHRTDTNHLRQAFGAHGTEVTVEKIVSVLAQDGVHVSHELTRQIRTEVHEEQHGSDEPPPSASVFFGKWDVHLNHVTAWTIIVLSTIVAASACYFLVEATRDTAVFLNVPTFFVAVILAAAVSSVPDTLLSIGAAKRGDDSGAVSNAFGSNIFDICICLSIPLLVNSYLNGWKPISLLQDGAPVPGLTGLRILLLVLSAITLAVIWHRRQINRGKAVVLCVLYLIFIGYAVAGSLGWFDALNLSI